MASEQVSIPTDVFSRDPYEPFISYKEDGEANNTLTKPHLGFEILVVLELEAMEIKKDASRLNDEPDWCIPYLQCLVNSVLPTDPITAR